MKTTSKRWALAGMALAFAVVLSFSVAALEGELWEIEAELEALREYGIGDANGYLWEAESILAHLKVVVAEGDYDAAIDLLMMAEDTNYRFESAMLDLTHHFFDIEQRLLSIKEPALHEAFYGDPHIALLVLKVEEEIALTKAVIGRAWLSSSILEQELCVQKKLMFIEIYQGAWTTEGMGEEELWDIEAKLEALREYGIEEAHGYLQEAENLLAELEMAVEAEDIETAIQLLLRAEEINFDFELMLADLTHDFLGVEEWFLSVKIEALHEALDGDLRMALLVLKVEEEIALTKAEIGRAWLNSSILEEELCVQKKLLILINGNGSVLWEIEEKIEALLECIDDAYGHLLEAEELLVELETVVEAGDLDAAIELLLVTEESNFRFESRLNVLAQDFVGVEEWFLSVKQEVLHEALYGDLVSALLLLKVEEEIALTKAVLARAWASSSILEQELCIQKKRLLIKIY